MRTDFIEFPQLMAWIVHSKCSTSLAKVIHAEQGGGVCICGHGLAIKLSMGSEVLTQDIMQELLGNAKEICLPRVVENNLSFRKIEGLKDLEKGSYGIMEPKENCSELEGIEIVLVPTVGITKNGVRLGYGYGYYDRFLASLNAKTISLTYSKQIVKSIPFSEKDVKIDWVVTEEKVIETSKFS